MITDDVSIVESVSNHHNAWYVIRSTFNRSMKAYDFLISHGFQAYLPLHVVEKPIKGRLQRTTLPLIPNMLFVYAKEDDIRTFVRENKSLNFISLYYNHFEQNQTGKDELLRVPTDQMNNFIKATMARNKHTMLVDPQKIKYKTGDTVRIVEGDFMGVVGKVARVGGQSRVIVTLDGVCSIATAYIPSAFLEPYESDK